jgi:hypothetical protein
LGRALIDGQPFMVEGEGFVAREGMISGGVFRVTQTLTFGDFFLMHNCRVIADHDGTIICMRGRSNVVSDCYIEGRGTNIDESGTSISVQLGG